MPLQDDEGRKGQLTIVGTGIRLAQITEEAVDAIKSADIVFVVIGEPVTRSYVHALNPNTHSLDPLYSPGKPRLDTYREMCDTVVSEVKQGKNVCFALYGHPGVFATPAHQALHRLRGEGYRARMLPGISSEACLIADLGIDPADCGWQSYEATTFICYDRTWDLHAVLLLWQVGLVGETVYRKNYRNSGLHYLADLLIGKYGPDHVVIAYEASPYVTAKDRVEKIRLKHLAKSRLNTATTLLVPPKGPPPIVPEILEEFFPETAAQL